MKMDCLKSRSVEHVLFQGYWNPHTHADPRLATAEFPHPHLSEARNIVRILNDISCTYFWCRKHSGIYFTLDNTFKKPHQTFHFRKSQHLSSWSGCWKIRDRKNFHQLSQVERRPSWRDASKGEIRTEISSPITLLTSLPASWSSSFSTTFSSGEKARL